MPSHSPFEFPYSASSPQVVSSLWDHYRTLPPSPHCWHFVTSTCSCGSPPSTVCHWPTRHSFIKFTFLFGPHEESFSDSSIFSFDFSPLDDSLFPAETSVFTLCPSLGHFLHQPCVAHGFSLSFAVGPGTSQHWSKRVPCSPSSSSLTRGVLWSLLIGTIEILKNLIVPGRLSASIGSE